MSPALSIEDKKFLYRESSSAEVPAAGPPLLFHVFAAIATVAFKDEERGAGGDKDHAVSGGLRDVRVDLIVVGIPAGVVGIPAVEDDLAFWFGAEVIEDVLRGAGPESGVEEVDVLVPVDDVQDDVGIREGKGTGAESGGTGEVEDGIGSDVQGTDRQIDVGELERVYLGGHHGDAGPVAGLGHLHIQTRRALGHHMLARPEQRGRQGQRILE